MNIRSLTKKKAGMHISTDSSFSKATGGSKPPKDILGLGKYLVSELGFGNGHDTLGRWMAHHLAELIRDAEKGATFSGRLKARKYAEQMIFKIWEKRYQLPGNAYPIANYKDIVAVLDTIRPGGNPWRSGYSSSERTNQSMASMFDEFSRLMIVLIFFQAPVSKLCKITPVSFANLSLSEQQMLLGLNHIFGIYQKGYKPPKKGKKVEMDSGESEQGLRNAIIKMIDQMIGTLSELKNEFREKSGESKVD